MPTTNPNKKFSHAMATVIARANSGFRLGSLHGAELAAAKRLIDKGKLHATLLPDRDFWITK